MPEALWLGVALLLSLLGMAAFALSLDTHWTQVGRSGEPPERALRLVGWAALAASLAACLAADHVSMAALVWPLTIGIAAAIVAFTLTCWPKPRRKR